MFFPKIIIAMVMQLFCNERHYLQNVAIHNYEQ